MPAPLAAGKNIVGSWKIDLEQTLSGIKVIPEGLAQKFDSLDAYRAYVRPKIEGGRFDISPDGSAVLRLGDGSATRMTWHRTGFGTFWVGKKIFMSASVGHIFVLMNDHEAICKFQMDYSESVAPRSPVTVHKITD